jgi:hypothetical protein
MWDPVDAGDLDEARTVLAVAPDLVGQGPHGLLAAVLVVAHQGGETEELITALDQLYTDDPGARGEALEHLEGLSRSSAGQPGTDLADVIGRLAKMFEHTGAR